MQPNQNIMRVMKMYNSDLRRGDDDSDEEGYSEEYGKKVVEQIKQKIDQQTYLKKESIQWLKQVLLQEILPHLKLKHGVYEDSLAEWYHDSLQPWGKQHCILIWDEYGLAKPQFWCNSGCQQCNDLYTKYEEVATQHDNQRIESMQLIEKYKRDFEIESQKLKSYLEQLSVQQYADWLIKCESSKSVQRLTQTILNLKTSTWELSLYIFNQNLQVLNQCINLQLLLKEGEKIEREASTQSRQTTMDKLKGESGLQGRYSTQSGISLNYRSDSPSFIASASAANGVGGNALSSQQIYSPLLKLSEPLPLLEKASGSNSTVRAGQLLASSPTTQLSQSSAKLALKKKDANNTGIGLNGSTKQRVAALQPLRKRIAGHTCRAISESVKRCDVCFGTMNEYYYHVSEGTTGLNVQSVRAPFNVCYVEYISTFAKKIESLTSQNVSQIKKFLQVSNLCNLKQLAFFLVDRDQPFEGLSDFLSEKQPNLPGPSANQVLQARESGDINIPTHTRRPAFLAKYGISSGISTQSMQFQISNVHSSQSPDEKGSSNKEIHELQQTQSCSEPPAASAREEEQLRISGDFECANIAAYSIDKTCGTVAILLRSDTNTKGCVHWFNFAVAAKLPGTVQFVILNNTRNGQFYKDGMKIAVRKEKDLLSLANNNNKNDEKKYENRYMATSITSTTSTTQPGWSRESDDTFYFKSNVDHPFYRPEQNDQQHEDGTADNKVKRMECFQTLEFKYTFTHANERVAFAYSYPYSYTDFIRFLAKTEKILLENGTKVASLLDDSNRSSNPPVKITANGGIKYSRKVIGYSRLGFPLYELKITELKEQLLAGIKKKAVYVIARQHPGETPSSFVCEGFIDYLLNSSSESAKSLRTAYVFKIIPMMNPDGVILGNTRCNASGFDLNRQWQHPDKVLVPEVYFAKVAIKRTQQKRAIELFLDLHGHSQQMGFFVFGCTKPNADALAWTKVRLFSQILSKKSPEAFVLDRCRFKVDNNRLSTARITAWNEFQVPLSFTIETSFYGFNRKVSEGKSDEFIHFSVEDLFQIGKDLGESLYEHTYAQEKLEQDFAKKASAAAAAALADKVEKKSQGKTTKKNGSNLQTSASIQASSSNSINSNNNTTNNSRKNKLKKRAASYIEGEESGSEDKSTTVGNRSSSLLPQPPTIQRDWRSYFEKKLLETNLKLIEEGQDPNELDSSCGSSDPEPDADLFKPEEWPFAIEPEDTMDKSKSELMELKAMMMNRDMRERKPLMKGQNSKARDYYPISTILYEVGNSCILASSINNNNNNNGRQAIDLSDNDLFCSPDALEAKSRRRNPIRPQLIMFPSSLANSAQQAHKSQSSSSQQQQLLSQQMQQKQIQQGFTETLTGKSLKSTAFNNHANNIYRKSSNNMVHQLNSPLITKQSAATQDPGMPATNNQNICNDWSEEMMTQANEEEGVNYRTSLKFPETNCCDKEETILPQEKKSPSKKLPKKSTANKDSKFFRTSNSPYSKRTQSLHREKIPFEPEHLLHQRRQIPQSFEQTVKAHFQLKNLDAVSSQSPSPGLQYLYPQPPPAVASSSVFAPSFSKGSTSPSIKPYPPTQQSYNSPTLLPLSSPLPPPHTSLLQLSQQYPTSQQQSQQQQQQGGLYSQVISIASVVKREDTPTKTSDLYSINYSESRSTRTTFLPSSLSEPSNFPFSTSPKTASFSFDTTNSCSTTNTSMIGMNNAYNNNNNNNNSNIMSNYNYNTHNATLSKSFQNYHLQQQANKSTYSTTNPFLQEYSNPYLTQAAPSTDSSSNNNYNSQGQRNPSKAKHTSHTRKKKRSAPPGNSMYHQHQFEEKPSNSIPILAPELETTIVQEYNSPFYTTTSKTKQRQSPMGFPMHPMMMMTVAGDKKKERSSLERRNQQRQQNHHNFTSADYTSSSSVLDSLNFSRDSCVGGGAVGLKSNTNRRDSKQTKVLPSLKSQSDSSRQVTISFKVQDQSFTVNTEDRTVKKITNQIAKIMDSQQQQQQQQQQHQSIQSPILPAQSQQIFQLPNPIKSLNMPSIFHSQSFI